MAPVAPTMEGNTKVVAKEKRMNAARFWCFTGYGVDGSNVSKVLGQEGYFHMGEEICPTTGRIHLQGFFQARQKMRPSEKFSALKFHWEPCKGSEKQNMRYTGKDGKVLTNMDIVEDPLAGKKPWKFQEEVLELINEKPDDRSIHWYWEPEGCAGKTTLMKSICMHREDVIVVDGKAADAKYMIASMRRKPKVVFMNLTRTREDFVSYEAIEAIKDGIFASTKYESSMVIMNSPHFIVFANFEPDYNKMSGDRWRVNRIER